jgi:hypothetical protein
VPPKPAWYPHISNTIALLESLPCALVDRKTVEQIFKIQERRARQIMSAGPGVRIGNAAAVERVALIQWLRSLEKNEDVTQEARRKARVGQLLEQAWQESKGRNVRVPRPCGPDSMASGVILTATELRVRFDSPLDLAAKLMRLAQDMASDWPAMEDRILNAPHTS